MLKLLCRNRVVWPVRKGFSTMKSQSQVRCILFALLLPISACGGGRDQSTPIGNMPVTDTLQRKDLPKQTDAVVGKFGDSEQPIARVEVPVVEHWIPTKLSECMSLGKELAAKGEHVRARELFTAAVKLDKKNAEPQLELARSYISTNDRSLAIKHANKAIKLAPESSHAYNTLGRAELLRHDYDAAIIAFRQATELNADNVWAWNNLGLVYLTLKDHQEAINALVEATSRKGTEGYMWNNLGLAYEQLDALDDARLAFENGAKLGSGAAKASRKRLEGVDTIVVAKTAKVEVEKQVETEDQTYDLREPMPEDVDGGDEVIDDVTVDDTEHADEPIVEQPEDEPIVEEPVPEAPTVPTVL